MLSYHHRGYFSDSAFISWAIHSGFFGKGKLFGESVLPIPFIKSGSMSMYGMEHPRYGFLDQQLALDLINNEGFSGGPMIWTDAEGTQRFGGIVTGLHEEHRVLSPPSADSKDWMYYQQNSGITLATSAARILALIDSSSGGFPFPEEP